MAAKSTGNVDHLGAQTTFLYKIRCRAISELIDTHEDDGMNCGYAKANSGDDHGRTFFEEEWAVLRPFRDFTTVHKHLKSQVAASQSAASAGARLVGAATAAFTFGEGGSGQRQRKGLIPSLGQATKAGALGVTKKSLVRRRDILNEYLAYVVSPNHLLGQCPELLRFLGAYVALPLELRTDKADSLGRIEMSRVTRSPASMESIENSRDLILQQIRPSSTQRTDVYVSPVKADELVRSGNLESHKQQSMQKSSGKAVAPNETVGGHQRPHKRKPSRRTRTVQMAAWASIKTRIDQVKLSQVRNALFQFIRHLFDLDNASFFRSRMLSAIKTMSFAVTSAQEFNKMLFKMHLTHVNGKAMGGWIKFVRDIVWPNGVFFESGPDLTECERRLQEEEARDILVKAFPDQLRTVLGQEIARDGLYVFHEMLQNRVVLKSMAYMIMDEVWLEIFPELSDVLTGTAVLESES